MKTNLEQWFTITTPSFGRSMMWQRWSLRDRYGGDVVETVVWSHSVWSNGNFSYSTWQSSDPSHSGQSGVKLDTKMKHVDIHRHWLRQEVQAGRIHVSWSPTSEMPADGFTKLLPRQKHKEFLRQLQLADIQPINQSEASSFNWVLRDRRYWIGCSQRPKMEDYPE